MHPGPTHIHRVTVEIRRKRSPAQPVACLEQQHAVAGAPALPRRSYAAEPTANDDYVGVARRRTWRFIRRDSPAGRESRGGNGNTGGADEVPPGHTPAGPSRPFAS